MKINNHSFDLKYQSLVKKKPDSIIDISSMSNSSWECGNPFDWEENSLKVIYIEGQEYITNGDDAFLYYAKFNETNSLLIKNENLILNEKTTVNHFKLFFKNSKVIEIENGYAIYNITFNPSQPEDNWMFYFDKKGHLLEFYLDWWLC